MDEARKRVAAIIPELQLAMAMAKIEVPDAVMVGLGVIAKKADGSGKFTATFEAEAFVADLALLFPEALTPPEEGDKEQAAVS